MARFVEPGDVSRVKQRIVALLPFALLVSAVVSVPTLVLDDEGLPHYRRLRTELNDVRETNAELARDIAATSREIDGLRLDPQSVERIARDELGMARPAELIFQFSE